MKNQSIYMREENLFNEFRNSYPERLRENIVDDGLCWASISNEIPIIENHFWPENLWEEAKRKIMFLLKEPNGNEGDDYKDWNWSEGNSVFGNVLAYWLEGLLTTTPTYCPTYSELSQNISRYQIFKKQPFAIVNIKKEAGDSIADWDEIWEHAIKNKVFLKNQIRQILRPNIIVCGGSNDNNNDYRKMISIVKDILYDDEKNGFVKINNWCHYNKSIDVLLIDSYHPTMRSSYSTKIDDMLLNFQQFISQTGYKN